MKKFDTSPLAQNFHFNWPANLERTPNFKLKPAREFSPHSYHSSVTGSLLHQRQLETGACN